MSETELQLTQSSEYEPIDLCERKANGLTVILYWLRATNSVYITTVEERTGEATYIEVPNNKAMDAFEHPFAYIKKI